MLYSIIGIPLCLIVLTDIGKVFTRGLKWIWSYVRRFVTAARAVKTDSKAEGDGKTSGRVSGTATPSGTLTPAVSRQNLYKRKKGEEEDYIVDDEFNLPPIIAILIAIIYMLFGVVLYRQWENWSFLEAFYFIFVSLSTIGFGDVLPDQPQYFLATSMYLLIGLSLVAMVINVVMEALGFGITKAKHTVLDVGKTIGLPLESLLEDPKEEVEVEVKKPTSLPPTRQATPSRSIPSRNGAKK